MPDPIYRRPFVNQSGETIPAFGVFEVGGWVDNSKGRSVFRAVKPTKDGKVYYVNGPLAVPNGANGWAASADGHWALYEGSSQPQLNQEYGPKAGSWALHADGKGGFVIIADPRGTAAPPPGFPTGFSSRRIRVKEQAKAEVVNRIQGTAASTATENSPQFLINKIVVLSGVDPRQDPSSEIEAITVQNNLRKAYTNGVDRVIATQSKSDQKWYVETTPAGGGNVITGTLRTDLTTRMTEVTINVLGYSSENPADDTGGVKCFNPQDLIRPGLQPTELRYLFCGNAGAKVTAAQVTPQATGEPAWFLLTVQPPIKPPIQPEDA